ncbi:MAG: ABC transporter ATP-binding protein [Lachnospiraceae bacterium]|nr:ABC transporter ATP-binding protein [Lachnospiraceae bacterium]
MTEETVEQILVCRDVKKTYITRKRGKRLRTEALNGLSFSMEKGDRLGVLGPSGCGKSTLLKCILGLERPDGGEIAFARRAGFVAQDPYSSISPRLTVEQIIEEPLLYGRMGIGRRERRERVREAMGQMRLDYEKYRRRYPHQLSGGERQRVSIARAVIASPEILVLDEPASMLDYGVKGEIAELLLNSCERLGASLLLVTHDVAFARRMCGRLLVMDGGKEVESGWTEQIYKEPQADFTARLFYAAEDIGRYWEEKDRLALHRQKFI